MHIVKKYFLFSALAVLWFSPSFVSAKGATLSISPPSGEFRVGSTFTATLLLNTRDDMVGRIRATIYFPADSLQIVNPVAGRSIITSWLATPAVSNFDGTVSFEGSMSPGIQTTGGTVLAIEFRVTAPGTADIAIRDAVLERADENGIAIPVETHGAALDFILAPAQGPAVQSPTHPDGNIWMADTNALFQWQYPASQGFSYLFDQEPYTNPPKISRGLATSFSLTVDHGGIWYLHLAALNEQGEWSETTHYAIRVDPTPPAKPVITLDRDAQNGRTRYQVGFSASDALSGIGRFEARITPRNVGDETDQGFFAQVASPLVLTDPKPGTYDIAIRAYDKAGNMSQTEQEITVGKYAWQSPLRIGSTSIPLTSPWLVAYAAVLLAAGAFAGLLRELWRHHRNLRRQTAKEAHQAETQLKRDLAALSLSSDGTPDAKTELAKAVEALHEAHQAIEADDKHIPEPPPSVP